MQNTTIQKISIADTRSLIPDFDGNPDDLHHFIDCVDTVINLTDDSQTPFFSGILKSKIKGQAHYLCQTKKLTDWESIKNEFSIALDEMKKIKQGTRESAKAKVQRFDVIYTEPQLAISKESSDACFGH